MSSSNRELRRALLERVDKHDGHWEWVGYFDNGVPCLVGSDGKTPARRASWEAWRDDPPPPGRIVAACGEPCIRPEHLAPGRCQAPGHRRDLTRPDRCRDCENIAARARRWTCACGREMQAQNASRHLRACAGLPVDTPTAIAELRATQDAVRDYQRGMTPERICEVYGMKPDTLAQRLRRQEARTPGEDELMHALDVYAKRALLARQRAERS